MEKTELFVLGMEEEIAFEGQHNVFIPNLKPVSLYTCTGELPRVD
jgi:hypothetical protein